MSSTDVFLSHNWGTDELGRDNHARVARINDALKLHGYKTWFDHEEMHGDITDRMAQGIEKTKAVIVFLTRKYYEKVNGEDERDNCKKEFRHSTQRKTRSNMIAVIMDSSMKKTSSWEGTICMCLCDKMFIDMSEDIEDPNYLNSQIQLLSKELKAIGIEPDDAGTKQQGDVIPEEIMYKNENRSNVVNNQSRNDTFNSNNGSEEMLNRSSDLKENQSDDSHAKASEIQSITEKTTEPLKRIGAVCQITSNYRNKKGDVILDLTSSHSDEIPINDDRKVKYLRLNERNYVLRISKEYSNELQNILSFIYKEQKEIHVPDESILAKHSLSGKSIIGIYSHTSVERYREISSGVNLEYNMVVANGQYIKVTPAELEEYCLRYLDCLSHDERDVFTESIEVFTERDTDVQNLVEKFKRIQKRILPDAFIGGYNPMEHCKFLYGHCDTTNEGFQKFLVVLRQEPFEILCLSMTFSEKIEDLLVEIQKGCRRVELVTKANSNVVKSIASKPSIYNIIVAPKIETVAMNKWCCKHCLVVPKEIYNDDTKMKDYFDDLPKCGLKKRCIENYKKLTSSIIGFVATNAENKTICNVTSHELIKFTRLTNQQQDILSSSDKKMIIQGDYGTGKTILGISLLKMIVESAMKRSRVWYVVFPKSELLLQKIQNNLNKFFPDKKKDKEREWCYTTKTGLAVDLAVRFASGIEGESMNVAKPSSVIRTLQNAHPNDIHHFIFDEYDGESLDCNEAESLKELSTSEEFKESYIVVLVQALEKSRTYHDGKSKIEHDKFKYSETGMTVCEPLKTAMRNPKQIHELLTAAKQLIFIQDNTFYHNAVENEERTQFSISPQSISNKEIASKSIFRLHHKNDVIRPESTNQNHPGKINSVKNAMTGVKTSSSLEPKKTQSVFIEHDVDIIASEFHDDNMKGDVKTTTKMLYHESRLGNKIECEMKPVFVRFKSTSVDDKERFAGLFIYFKYHFFKNIETTALFICDDVKHQTMYQKILKFVDKKHILLNDLNKEEYLKGHSIICNTRSSSGYEFPNVVVCVHPEEHHLRHHFVDNVSRCTSHLTMVCLSNYNPTTSGLSDTTLHYVVKELQHKKLFESILLEFDHSLYSSRKYSFDEKKSTTFKINRKSDEFKEFRQQSLESIFMKNLPTKSELLKRLTDGLAINTLNDEDGGNDGVPVADEENDDNKTSNVKRKRLDDQPFESSSIKKNLPTRDEDGGNDGVPVPDEENDDNKTTNVSSDFDSYSEADIKQLILNEDIKKLKSISSQWPNVVVKSLHNQTPLHYASRHGRADIIKILIDSGANVHVVDSDNRTPLHYASLIGHADIVKILIDSGANVHVVNSDNQTPLHDASCRGRAEVVKILIDSGANVHVVDSDNQTPLHDASRRGRADIVKILIDSGANVHVGDRYNQTPLHYASYFGHADIVKILIDSGANVHVVDSFNETPLHKASYFGHADIVKILIDSGANVHVVDSYNRTPLHKASYFGHADIVKILIDSGANVHVVDSFNETPLHKASDNGHADVVKILKKHGAVMKIDKTCKLM